MDKESITVIFILILLVILLMLPEVLYAVYNDQPECIFARDVVTCVKVGRNQ